MLIKSHFIFSQVIFNQDQVSTAITTGIEKIVDNSADKEGGIEHRIDHYSRATPAIRARLLPNRVQAQKKRAEQRYNTSFVPFQPSLFT